MKFGNAVKMIAIRFLSITVLPLLVGFALWGVAYVLGMVSQFVIDYVVMAWQFVQTYWKPMLVILIIIAIALAISDGVMSSWTKSRSRKDAGKHS